MYQNADTSPGPVNWDVRLPGSYYPSGLFTQTLIRDNHAIKKSCNEESSKTLRHFNGEDGPWIKLISMTTDFALTEEFGF